MCTVNYMFFTFYGTVYGTPQYFRKRFNHNTLRAMHKLEHRSKLTIIL